MPKKKPRKPKAKTYGALKRELDRIFSIWVRSRAADENGVARCITCGMAAAWIAMDCGHWLSRRFNGTRWEPTNCAAQCKGCNKSQKLDGRNAAIFGRAIIARYGQDEYDRLIDLSSGVTKLGKADLSALIERYSNPIPETACISIKDSSSQCMP